MLPESIDGHKIRHALEVRHESFAVPEFIALARKHKVAIVLAADSKYPQIADITAPFVYARIMGTTKSEAKGYSARAMTQWAKHAQELATGVVPKGLKTASEEPTGKAQHDVFLYVISGFKERNPAAALGIAERLE